MCFVQPGVSVGSEIQDQQKPPDPDDHPQPASTLSCFPATHLYRWEPKVHLSLTQGLTVHLCTDACWFPPSKVMFCLLCRPVPVRHDGILARLSEEGEGEDGSFPGFGSAGGGRQRGDPAVPLKDPGNHKSSAATKGLRTQVSHLKPTPEYFSLCSDSGVQIKSSIM